MISVQQVKQECIKAQRLGLAALAMLVAASTVTQVETGYVKESSLTFARVTLLFRCLSGCPENTEKGKTRLKVRITLLLLTYRVFSSYNFLNIECNPMHPPIVTKTIRRQLVHRPKILSM